MFGPDARILNFQHADFNTPDKNKLDKKFINCWLALSKLERFLVIGFPRATGSSLIFNIFHISNSALHQ